MKRSIRPGVSGCNGKDLPMDSGTLAKLLNPVPGFREHAVRSTGRVVGRRSSDFDVEPAIRYLESHVGIANLGKCAYFIREAVKAGGFDLQTPRRVLAQEFGPLLLKLGFSAIGTNSYLAKRGDVAVLQPPSGHIEGHVQMYNGTIWLSDYRQNEDVYPNDAYRRQASSFHIFRA